MCFPVMLAISSGNKTFSIELCMLGFEFAQHVGRRCTAGVNCSAFRVL